ncbi:hypothetical protein Tco_0480254 [Tanacetum coccineum]
MSTRSTSSNIFSPLRDPESLIRRRNLGEPSSLFDFEEVMSIPHNNLGTAFLGTPTPNNMVHSDRLRESYYNQSGVAYSDLRFQHTPYPLEEVERENERQRVKLDECLALADLGASINLNALSVWETAFSPDNCEPCMILGIRRTMVVIRKVSPKMFLMARALIDVYGEELTLRVDDEAITFKVGQTLRYSRSYETVNQVNVIDVACEEYAQKCSIFG